MSVPTITAVLCVRNEAALLLDWLAHHLVCGVSHVVVASNDSEDGTDAMLDRLHAMGLITHLRNDGPHDEGGVQFTGLRLADDTDAVRDADWLVALDIDEYVVVHTGDGTLPALFEAVPDATAFALPWRYFGNSGLLRYEDRPVTAQFTRAAPARLLWPWRASLFKTLYRNDGSYARLGVHRPRDPDPDRADAARWVDGNGAALPDRFATGGTFTEPGHDRLGLVQVNHYALGSMASFLLKAARGRAVHAEDRLGMDYWTERNWCTEEDRCAVDLPGVAEARAALAEDPQLAQLHEAAVAWRHARIGTLLERADMRSLMGRLMMTPPARPIPDRLALELHKRANEAAPRGKRARPG